MNSKAQEKLDGIIKATTCQFSGSLSADITFSALWARTRRSSPRPGARELTRDPLQELLNRMAESGDSVSAVKQARTYIGAALEYARDERLIETNPARKLELSKQLLRKP